MSKSEATSAAVPVALDSDIEAAMQRVNWYDVSLPESRSLGVSIGVMQDAELHQRTADYSLTQLSWLVLACVVVDVAGAVFRFSVDARIVGMLAVLIITSLAARIMSWAAATNVKAQRKALLEEVKELALVHPLPPPAPRARQPEGFRPFGYKEDDGIDVEVVDDSPEIEVVKG